jgi:hypothetical protein
MEKSRILLQQFADGYYVISPDGVNQIASLQNRGQLGA